MMWQPTTRYGLAVPLSITIGAASRSGWMHLPQYLVTNGGIEQTKGQINSVAKRQVHANIGILQELSTIIARKRASARLPNSNPTL